MFNDSDDYDPTYQGPDGTQGSSQVYVKDEENDEQQDLLWDPPTVRKCAYFCSTDIAD